MVAYSVLSVAATRISTRSSPCRLQAGESSNEIMYSEDDVKQIVDLGFTDDQAKQALVANNYRLDSAIEWLLAGQHNTASASSTRRGEGAAARPRRRRGNSSINP